ncbi:MAG: heterodisulfide reductase-related iron-sulfur binding cluster [Cyclobacteriaceae bacterium]|nr:heterodisulfide reductase-related iron-sulfur binding cluster [Cyclobacteriaceae bacterium]
MNETREIYRNFPFLMQIAFYVIAFATIGFFVYGFYLRIRKYKKGRDAGRMNNVLGRFMKAAAIMGKNSTVFKRDAYAGAAHWMIFWGFVFLLIGTAIVALDHDFLRLLGYHLLEGDFYLVFSFVLDIFGVLFLIGLLMMMFRRAKKLPKLDYTRNDLKPEQYNRKGYSTDDKIFLWLLFLIGLTGFFIEGLRISADNMPAFEMWSPVGWVIASSINSVGLAESANSLHVYSWWFHAVMVMFFIAYIPYSKAMHMLVDYANLMFKDDMAAKKLPKVAEEMLDAGMGYKKVEDFTWKELLDFDSCTKCGRCHDVCPARNAGTALSPRDLILDLRTYVDSSIGSPEWFKQEFVNGKNDSKEIAGGVISKDVLWSCTTCMACVEVCPVGIEHLTSIVNLRRSLVDEGNMEDMLQDTLMNIGDYGNSFGQSERNRAAWTKELDFKIKDVRKEEAEYLWFVGDYASYDQRIQGLSRHVAKILNKIGVDYGIMYEGEKNSGNDVRRVGEEGLYEMLVEDNLAVMQKSKFKKIFSTDPHSYNTIKNEYPEFGGDFEIEHYTGLLLRLVKEGKIKFTKKLNYKVTYHDPCYLGRYNGEVDAPRELLTMMGIELIDMPRCKENSFCCGAGGGRIWMDDSKVQERPSEIRIREALTLGEEVTHFVVACPKDYAMFTDAVKTSGNEGKMEVKDIIQLVEEAMGE